MVFNIYKNRSQRVKFRAREKINNNICHYHPLQNTFESFPSALIADDGL